MNVNQLEDQNASGQTQPPAEDAALFVGNLSPETTDQKLFEYFMPFGKVFSAQTDQLLHHQEEPLHRGVPRHRLHQFQPPRR